MKPEDLKVRDRVDRRVGAVTTTGTVLGVSTEHDAVWIKWDGAGYPTSHDLTALAQQITPSRGMPPVLLEPYHLKRIGKAASETPYDYGSFPTRESALEYAKRWVGEFVSGAVTLDQFYIVDMSHREWLV